MGTKKTDGWTISAMSIYQAKICHRESALIWFIAVCNLLIVLNLAVKATKITVKLKHNIYVCVLAV